MVIMWYIVINLKYFGYGYDGFVFWKLVCKLYRGGWRLDRVYKVYLNLNLKRKFI